MTQRRTCRYFSGTGSCRNGDACRFAHETPDVVRFVSESFCCPDGVFRWAPYLGSGGRMLRSVDDDMRFEAPTSWVLSEMEIPETVVDRLRACLDAKAPCRSLVDLLFLPGQATPPCEVTTAPTPDIGDDAICVRSRVRYPSEASR